MLVGLDSPDDCAVVANIPGMASVHTVDFFRSFIEDPYVFGKIAANHSLRCPSTTLVLPKYHPSTTLVVP